MAKPARLRISRQCWKHSVTWLWKGRWITGSQLSTGSKAPARANRWPLGNRDHAQTALEKAPQEENPDGAVAQGWRYQNSGVKLPNSR